MGDQALLHADHKHAGKLQAFGGVQRQQSDGVLLASFSLSPMSRPEGDFLDESSQIGFLGPFSYAPMALTISSNEFNGALRSGLFLVRHSLE